MNIRIVLLPNKHFTEVAKKHSALIAEKYQSYFKLDDTHIPHATVIAAECSNEVIPKISALLKNLSGVTNEINFGILKPKAAHEDFIGIYFENNREIEDLKNKSIDLTGSYLSNVSSSEEAHLTLTRLKSKADVSQAIKLISSLPGKGIIFNFLAICEDAEHGTCKRILAKFRLKRSNR